MSLLISHSNIALIKLPSPVEPSDYVKTIELSCSPAAADTEVITMGYGLVTPEIYPHHMQYTKLKTIDFQECQNKTKNLIKTRRMISKNSVICANGLKTRNSDGDSGNLFEIKKPKHQHNGFKIFID